MKRLICILMILTLLPFFQACQPTAAMLDAERDYYRYNAEIMKARSVPNKPLLEIKAMDPKKDMVFSNAASIVVYAPPQQGEQVFIPQFRQVDYSEKWIPAVTGIAAGLIGVGGMGWMAHELKGINSGTNYNMYGQGSSVKTQGGTTANLTNSTTGTVGAMDATSTPTVVEQPAPIIVTQPEPVIIPQPAPVIVQ